MADGTITLKTEVDTSGVNKGIGSIKSVIGKVGKSFAAVGAAGAAALAGISTAAVAGAKKTAAYGDRVDKLSQKIGMTKESFQQWDYIMQINGSSIETLQMGMKTLSNAAQSGSEAFDKLGLSQEYVKTASPEQLFESTITALQGMEEGTERTAIASKLLGRSATELAPLLNSGAESIEELKQKAIDYGFVMSDEAVAASAAFTDSLTTLGMTATGLRNKLMSEFLPSITKITDGLAQVFTGDFEGFDKITEGFSDFFGKLSEGFEKIKDKIPQLLEGLGTQIASSLPAIFDQALSLVPELIETLTTISAKMWEKTPEIATKIVEKIPDIITTITETLPSLMQPIGEEVLAVGDIISEKLPELAITLAPKFAEMLNTAFTSAIDTITQNPESISKLFNFLQNSQSIAIPQINIGDMLTRAMSGEIDTTAIWEKVKSAFGKIGELLKAELKIIIPPGWRDAFNLAVEAAKIVVDKLPEYVSGKAREIANKFSQLPSTIGGFFNSAVEAAKKVWANVEGFFSGVGRNIGNAFSSVPSTIGGFFNSAVEAAKRVWGNVAGFFSGVGRNIANAFSSVPSTIGGFFNSAVEAAKRVWANVPSFFTGVGRNIVQGIINGVTGAAGALYSTLQTLATNALNAAKSALGIHSPSRIFRDEVGIYIPMGIAAGIEKAGGVINEALFDLLHNVVSTATAGLLEDRRSEVKKVLDKNNKQMLQSERKYADESLRIERERDEAEYQERLASAKDSEEIAKIKAEREKELAKRAEDEYLNVLKDQAEKEREIYDARQKDIENYKNNAINAFKDITENAINSIQELQKTQESFADKLSEYGGVWDATEKNKFTLKGTNIIDVQKETREINKFVSIMEKLKDKLPKDLFDELLKMNVEEAQKTAKSLINMSEWRLNAYVDAWKARQEAAVNATASIYGDQEKKSDKILANFDKQTETLDKFNNLLTQIEAKGVPREFFAELREMGVDEGIEYASALLNLTDDKFNNYIKSWQKKQSTAAQIAKRLYRVEAENIASEIASTFENTEQEFFGYGSKSEQMFEEGFLAEFKGFIQMLKGTIESAFGGVVNVVKDLGFDVTSVPVPAMVTGGVVPYNSLTTVSQQLQSGADMSEIKRLLNEIIGRDTTATVIMEVDGREFGDAVVKFGNEAERRIGVSLVE